MASPEEEVSRVHSLLLAAIETHSLSQVEQHLKTESSHDVIRACQQQTSDNNETLLHQAVKYVVKSCYSIKRVIPPDVSILSTLLAYLQENEEHQDQYLSILMTGDGVQEGAGVNTRGGSTILHRAVRNAAGKQQLVRTIIQSLPDEGDRLKLITKRNNLVLLPSDISDGEYHSDDDEDEDEDEDDETEGNETMLHIGYYNYDIVKIVLESLSSIEYRVDVLLEMDKYNCSILRWSWMADKGMVTYLLKEAITDNEQRLRLILSKDRKGNNLLIRAMKTQRYHTVNTIIESLSERNEGNYLAQLALNKNPETGESLAFVVQSDKDLPFIDSIMKSFSSEEKVNFVTQGTSKRNVFHAFSNEFSYSIPIMKFYLAAFPSESLIEMLRLQESDERLTPLDMAAKMGSPEVLAILTTAQKQCETPNV